MDAMMLLALSAENAKRSMSVPSVMADYEDQLEELSEGELLTVIEQAKAKTNMLQLENYMLESFLARTNRKLLNGLQRHFEQKGKASVLASRRLMAAASSMLSSSEQVSHRSSDTLSSPLPSSFVRSGSIKIASILNQAPRLMISQKCELVGRELEEVLAAAVRYRACYVRQQSSLVAELENAQLMLQELTEATARFHTSLADPHLSASKFIRILEDTVKNVDFRIQKLQLRKSMLHQQYRQLQKQLQSGSEQGIGPADLEELHIASEACAARFEEQHVQFFKLHDLAGQYTLQENNSQRALKEQFIALECLGRQLCSKRAKLSEVPGQVRQLEVELASAEKSYIVMKTLHETYQIPDTMEYLKKKVEVEDLERQLKTWQRKNKVQHATLKMNTQTFQRLIQAAKSQDKCCRPASTTGQCFLTRENSHLLSRKPRVTIHDVVQMASSNRNHTRGIAVV